MYDMYPEAWIVTDRQVERPRRRPRKPHSVLPAVVAHPALDPKSARSA
ncbi:MAG: hypothetical protein JWP61_1185 [Friedmanniella sp.]|nr:hypothetical protein [Friedmanniella sp.]